MKNNLPTAESLALKISLSIKKLNLFSEEKPTNILSMKNEKIIKLKDEDLPKWLKKQRI